MGRKTQHRHHGDPSRFEVIANFVYDRYGKNIKYIADVAGGQGMLSRILNKQYNYQSEVIDPRGWVIKGIANRLENFSPLMANYYDLIIGVHPDEATRAISEAALVRPTIIIPCCNFWSEEKLGVIELVEAIEKYYRDNNVFSERITFDFNGPKNIGLVTEPPKQK